VVPVVRFLGQPSEDDDSSAGESLRLLLADPAITSVTIVVAWVRYRGLGRVRAELADFSARGGRSRIILGIDEGGATRPGLLGAMRRFTEAYVFHDRSGGTFHPKVYLGEGETKAVLRVGSSNLTPGGLFFNDEASLEVEFELPADAPEPALVGVHEYIDRLLADEAACKQLDEELIDQLVADPRYRVSATERRPRRTDVPLPPGAEEEDVTEEEEGEAPAEEGIPPIFGTSARTRAAVPRLSGEARAELAEFEGEEEEPAPAPRTPTPRREDQEPREQFVLPIAAEAPEHEMLLIEVRPHHNGEVFLSKTAVDQDPAFFGFPFTGLTAPHKPENPPYPMASPDPRVEIVVHDENATPVVRVNHDLNLVYYTTKGEIRMTIPPEPLGRIPQMSLLVMAREPAADLDYRLDFYPPDCKAPTVQQLRERLTNQLPSGGAAEPRRFGWA
jgi:hypothetical protein